MLERCEQAVVHMLMLCFLPLQPATQRDRFLHEGAEFGTKGDNSAPKGRFLRMSAQKGTLLRNRKMLALRVDSCTKGEVSAQDSAFTSLTRLGT